MGWVKCCLDCKLARDPGWASDFRPLFGRVTQISSGRVTQISSGRVPSNVAFQNEGLPQKLPFIYILNFFGKMHIIMFVS